MWRIIRTFLLLPGVILLEFSVGKAVAQSAEQSNASMEVEDVIIVTASPRRTAVDRRSYDVSTRSDAIALSARQVIESLPGVITGIDGELSILGQSRIIYLVDGQYFPSDLAVEIPASQIERVEIITNPGADSKGDGIVINLILKERFSAPQSLTVTARADTRDRYRLAASYSADTPRWQRLVNVTVDDDTVRRTTVQDLAYFAADQVGQTGNRTVFRDEGTDEAVLFSLFSRKLPGGRAINLSLNGQDYRFASSEARRFTRSSGDELLLGRTEDSLFENESRSLGGALGYNREYAADDRMAITLSYSHSEGRQRQTDRVAVETVDAEIAQLGIMDFDRTVDGRSHTFFLIGSRDKKDGATELKLGLDLRYADETDIFFVELDSATVGLMPDGSFEKRAFEGALFASYAFPVAAFSWLPGLRCEVLEMSLKADDQDLADDPSFVRFLPSLHVAYDVHGWGTLKGSVAQKTLTPDDASFDPVRRRTRFDRFEEGDAALRIGTSTNYELSHEIEFGKATFLTTLYRREKTDRIGRFYDFLGDDLFLTRFINVERDDSTGLNLNASQKIGSRFEHAIDMSFYHSEQEWTVDEREFDRSLTSYDAKYNLEYTHDKRHSMLAIMQLEGPGLNLNGEDEARLSSTLRYVRTFESGLVLTLEGIDLLATNSRDATFVSDTVTARTVSEFQERGLRVTVAKRF